jgi:hypothetical protein
MNRPTLLLLLDYNKTLLCYTSYHGILQVCSLHESYTNSSTKQRPLACIRITVQGTYYIEEQVTVHYRHTSKYTHKSSMAIPTTL